MRSIRTYGYGFDVSITEEPCKHGLRIKVELQGITLTRKQQRLLARSLALWKHGLTEVEPEQASPFAQATGLPEYVSM